LERLLERLKRWGVRLSCADGLEACAVLIPQGLLYVVKEETTIKRDHARQPHGLVRICRRGSLIMWQLYWLWLDTAFPFAPCFLVQPGGGYVLVD
jgi:IS1 family transposase